LTTFKATLAYDGTGLVGWQRQASGTSVQGLLEDALREFDDREVAVVGAGRTDAGVHARAQAASFSLDRAIDADVLVRALNAKLPENVRVTSACEAPAGFHARFDARRKTYQYRIWNDGVLSPFEARYVWHIADRLDADAMNAAAQRLEGTHDFAAFQAAGSDVATTERTMFSAGAIREAPQVVFTFTANGFLRHMVRSIVGTLVEIGRGRRDGAWIDELLASRDRTKAGRTAPAAGLFLTAVSYGDALADNA
jgi:tRNA pseudouridine38-40 synthase